MQLWRPAGGKAKQDSKSGEEAAAKMEEKIPGM